jgi:predicted neutral ceramidase superfamily lipid hydrolase
MCTLDLHLDWVVLQLEIMNAFKSMSKGVIFQKLCAIDGNIIQLIPFVHAFYAFEFPMFYRHYNCESNVTIIPSTMETYQGDPLGRALFTLAHFTVLCFITNHFLSCLFPSITNVTHIIGPVHYIFCIWTFTC